MKNIILISSLLKTGFFIFCFAIYKIVASEYSNNVSMYLYTGVATVMRNQEMLKFVPHHLESKRARMGEEEDKRSI